ncbi:hypothetical protein VP01_893g3 [Puccinia sorghi]|uniref:Uncharacterized protein n=1 Tax=Puccinia sorghi TaxID=27349 RepID=A0A0L6U800_9BASI|nr:hypothetical protein VP01_893g3 [Puccinia sorghi]
MTPVSSFILFSFISSISNLLFYCRVSLVRSIPRVSPLLLLAGCSSDLAWKFFDPILKSFLSSFSSTITPRVTLEITIRCQSSNLWYSFPVLFLSLCFRADFVSKVFDSEICMVDWCFCLFCCFTCPQPPFFKTIQYFRYHCKKKLSQLPAVDMQKVPGSFCSYSNHSPKVIQPSFDAQSLCRLHSDFSKTYTYSNMQLSKLFLKCKFLICELGKVYNVKFLFDFFLLQHCYFPLRAKGINFFLGDYLYFNKPYPQQYNFINHPQSMVEVNSFPSLINKTNQNIMICTMSGVKIRNKHEAGNSHCIVNFLKWYWIGRVFPLYILAETLCKNPASASFHKANNRTCNP